MNARLLLIVLLVALIVSIFYFVPQASKVWKWALYGPVKRMATYKDGIGIEYASGHLEYSTGDKTVDISRELYDTPRVWQLCFSRYGENGTVAKMENRTYWEMIDEVNANDGQLTFVDIFTGLVHIRLTNSNGL